MTIVVACVYNFLFLLVGRQIACVKWIRAYIYVYFIKIMRIDRNKKGHINLYCVGLFITNDGESASLTSGVLYIGCTM